MGFAGVLALVLAWCVAPPRVPPGAASAPPPDGPRLGPGALDLERLGDQVSGWIRDHGSGDGLDPRAWQDRLQSSEPMRAWRGFVGAGGRPEELDGELRSALRALDARLAAGGLPRAFHPWLYVEPAGRPISFAGADLGALGIAQGLTASGWMGTALTSLMRCRQLLGGLEAELARRGPAALPARLAEEPSLGYVLDSMDAEKLMGLHRMAMGSPRFAAALRPFMAPAAEAFAEGVYAATRALREERGPRAEEWTLGLTQLLGVLRAPFYWDFASAPGPVLAAGLPETLAAQCFGAVLLEHRVHLVHEAGLTVPVPSGEAHRAFVTGLGLAPAGRSGRLLSMQLARVPLLRSRERRQYERMAELFRTFRPRIEELGRDDPGFRYAIAIDLGTALVGRPEVARHFAREDLEALASWSDPAGIDPAVVASFLAPAAARRALVAAALAAEDPGGP